MPVNFQTCDLCDAHKREDGGAFRVLPPVFHHYGGMRQFAGPVATLKCFEDNSLVKQAVDSAGNGRVLVVDGGGSLRKALVGGATSQRQRRATAGLGWWLMGVCVTSRSCAVRRWASWPWV